MLRSISLCCQLPTAVLHLVSRTTAKSRERPSNNVRSLFTNRDARTFTPTDDEPTTNPQRSLDLSPTLHDRITNVANRHKLLTLRGHDILEAPGNRRRGTPAARHHDHRTNARALLLLDPHEVQRRCDRCSLAIEAQPII
jgi:hypothetical protein